MRSIIFAAVSAAVALGSSAYAVAQTSPKAEQGAQQQQSGAPAIKALNIVDIADLPAEAKSQVEEVAAKASKEEKAGLQSALDRSPAIKKALADKGANSSMVVATNLGRDGTLTLVTKKRG